VHGDHNRHRREPHHCRSSFSPGEEDDSAVP
jgi:hypothetical protein